MGRFSTSFVSLQRWKYMQMNNGNHLDDFRATDCTCSFLYAHINVHRVQLDQECRE